MACFEHCRPNSKPCDTRPTRESGVTDQAGDSVGPRFDSTSELLSIIRVTLLYLDTSVHLTLILRSQYMHKDIRTETF